MPCYRCGVRQSDPGRGESPWKRGVRRNSQVLICPGCQASADWTAELDRCPRCSSVHLVRRLGEVECRDCGTEVPPPGEAAVTAGPVAVTDTTRNPDLSEEVARALERVLRQGLATGPGSRPGAGGQPLPGGWAGPGGHRAGAADLR
jgi:hypothetical protein